MDVVAYLHNYPPGRLVGGELMTSLLLEALVAGGHDVRCIVHEADAPRVRNGVKILPRRKAMLEGDIGKCDVFVSHPEIAVFARNRVGSAKYVAIVHNLNAPTIDGLRLGRARLVVSNSAAVNDVAGCFGQQSMVMHPPTPSDRHPSPPGSERRFVTLVNLSEEKGGGLFFRLAEARPDLLFLGVTGGHGVQVSPERLPANVWLVGQSESMGLIHSLTRVLIAPSSTETYGMAAAEACVAGIPVLAHALPGVVEALGEGAVYCDRDSTNQWLAALADLDDDAAYVNACARASRRGAMLAARSEADTARFVTELEKLALSSA